MYVRLAHHRRFWCLLSDERETELTFGRFWRILQVIWRAVPARLSWRDGLPPRVRRPEFLLPCFSRVGALLQASGEPRSVVGLVKVNQDQTNRSTLLLD